MILTNSVCATFKSDATDLPRDKATTESRQSLQLSQDEHKIAVMASAQKVKDLKRELAKAEKELEEIQNPSSAQESATTLGVTFTQTHQRTAQIGDHNSATKPQNRDVSLPEAKSALVDLCENVRTFNVLWQTRGTFPRLTMTLRTIYNSNGALRKARNFICHGEGHGLDYSRESLDLEYGNILETFNNIDVIEGEMDSMKRDWDTWYTSQTNLPVFKVMEQDLEGAV